MKGLTEEQERELIPDGTILLGYRGSVAHGTYTPKYGPDQRDDKDLLGVAIGPIEVYLGLAKFEHHIREIEGKDGVIWDAVTYELRKFVRLMLAANPNVLSLLWLPEHLYVMRTELGNRLIAERDIFSSKAAYKSFVGYAHGQLHRMTHPSGKHMGKKRRELVLKYGYDCKNASHLIRILRLGIEFLATGELNIVRPDAAELIEIKRGEWPLGRVEKLADTLFDRAHEALIHSPLPERPDRERAEELCVEIICKWHLGNRGRQE